MKKNLYIGSMLAFASAMALANEPPLAVETEIDPVPSVQASGIKPEVSISMEKASSLVKKVTNDLVGVLSLFPAPEGMTGVVMKSPSGKGIGWISPRGEHLFLGAMVNSEGKNLSIEAHDKYIGNELPAPPKHGQELVHDLDALAYILLGKKGGAPVYVFADMRCHYCERLYKTLTKDGVDLEKRGIEIHWVPVGILGPESVKQAASLLMAPALSQTGALERHYGVEALPTEIKDADSQAGRQALADVAKNTSVFTALGTGTPLLVYWDGSDTQVVPGLPSKEEIDKIFSVAKRPASK